MQERGVSSGRRAHRHVGPGETASTRSRLVDLPADVEIIPMRALAYRMAELSGDYLISTLGAEAIAAAESLDAPLCVWSGDDGPRIRDAMEALGRDHRTIQR